MRKLWASLSKSVGSSRSPEPPLSPTSQNGVVGDQELWRGPSPSSTSKTKWNPEFASDPAVWESQFLEHWEKLRKLISHPSNNVTKTFNEVRELLGELCNLLIMEINSQPEATIGQLLEHCFNQEIFCVSMTGLSNFLYTLCLCVRSCFSRLTKPILVPLLKLLQWCRKSAEERRFQLSNVDKYFVQLLNQICTRISDDLTLLDSSLTLISVLNLKCRIQPMGLCLSKRLLIPYMYSAEDIGQLARDALLLLMAVSHHLDFLAKHVSEISNFCLCLQEDCRAAFPNYLDVYSPPYKSPNMTIPQSPTVLQRGGSGGSSGHNQGNCSLFYDGFLLEVFKPAVLQADVEDLVSKVVYFHLCVETVTEPALIQALLKVLIVGETNVRDMNLLEIILSKMNTSEKLCRIVLSLLRTLLELRCEDLMWNCLIRFILPFIPLKPSSRRLYSKLQRAQF
uniref:Uncharacterized protein n=1 Tax=Ditylenchus dipsaci TaxID=166011 RepID=A0A915CQM7_9BILA